MTLSDYLATLRRGWRIVLATLVVAVLCAGAVVFVQPKTYTPSTELFVAAAVHSKRPEELYQRNLIATNRVLSYVEVVNGNVVRRAVEKEVGHAVDPKSVDTTVPSGTVVIRIGVTDEDPEFAVKVARAYADVVPGVIDQLERVDNAPLQVRVNVIDEAEVPKDPDGSPAVAILAVAVMLGLGVGFVIVILREVLRREREEVD